MILLIKMPPYLGKSQIKSSNTPQQIPLDFLTNLKHRSDQFIANTTKNGQNKHHFIAYKEDIKYNPGF